MAERGARVAGALSGWISTPEGLIEGTLRHAGGRIISVEGTLIDPAIGGFNPTGLSIVPGFIDLHNHGGAGVSFPTATTAEAGRAVGYHRDRGTTTMLASLVSAPVSELRHRVRELVPLCTQGRLHGIHLEGPFINRVRCGAQNPAHIYPGDATELDRILEAGAGHIRSLTLAPETGQLGELLDRCAEHRVIVSFGHTDADYATTARAVAQARARGLTVTATHLFNAMPPLHHRSPGAVGALLAAAARDEAFVELIADGVHLDDTTVELFAGPNALFVTDAMAAAGMPEGRYTLGVLDVQFSGGIARLAGGGALAGGVSTLAEQFRRHVRRGMTLVDASRATSATPARVLGLKDRGLAPGGRADIVCLDSTGSVLEVITAADTIEGHDLPGKDPQQWT